MSPIQRLADNKISVYTRRLLSGDIYYARYKISNQRVSDGQRYITESLGTTDERIAIDRARQRYAEICIFEQTNRAIRTGSVKSEIAEFIQQYEDGVKRGLRGYSDHMLIGFRKTIVRYFTEFLGSKQIQDVCADDLKRYESWRHEYWSLKASAGIKLHGNAKQTPALRTIEWEINAFKQFLRWSSERGNYSGDALKFKYSVEKRQSRPAFTDEQIDTLCRFTVRDEWQRGAGKHGHDKRLTRYRTMLGAYVAFIAGTGLRPGEARNLRWCDIKYNQAADHQEIIEVFVHASHSKVNATRTAIGVQLAAFAISTLQLERRENSDHCGENDYVWCDTDGKLIQDFREGFNALIKAAGVEKDSMGQKLTIYSLRHYYISSRIRNNVDIYDLAKNTGTSLEMIRTFYDHVPNSDRLDELTKYRE